MSRKSFDTETLKNIGERIRGVRGSRSQQQFADEIGVSRSVISNYEAGRRLPNGEILKKISDLGGKTPGWVLTGGADRATDKQFHLVEKYFEENRNSDGHGRSIKSLISDDEMSLIILVRELDDIGFRNVYVYVMNEFKNRHNKRVDDMTNYAIPEYDKLMKSIKEDSIDVGKDPFRMMYSVIHHASDPEEKSG